MLTRLNKNPMLGLGCCLKPFYHRRFTVATPHPALNVVFTKRLRGTAIQGERSGAPLKNFYRMSCVAQNVKFLYSNESMKTNYWIHVNGNAQILLLKQQQHVISRYPISTAKNGFGEQRGSEMTPRGWHEIGDKIGMGMAINSVFVARQPTGECYSRELAQRYPERDWILSRILWLKGLEAGRNLGGEVDSRSRYIYIHGTPDSESLGVPRSHGCIRMANDDIMHLFGQIEQGCVVLIEEMAQ